MRVLGIDLGGTRTGLALSDPLGLICSPLGTIVERDAGALTRKIVEAAGEHGVGRIVIGLPRPLSGGTNEQIETVLSFRARLERETDIRVVTWDERFTSKLAEQAGRSAAPRDAVAACYMLQNYLDSCTDVTGDEETHERQEV